MAIAVTINANEVFLHAGSLEIFEGINGRASARFALDSLDGSYQPECNDEVIIEFADDYSGGLPVPEPIYSVLFAGVITERTINWLVLGTPTRTVCVAADYTHYADRRLLTATTTGGFSGRDALDYIVDNYLAVFGVTRDPSMPAGGTLGALSYDLTKVTDVINDIVRLAAPAGWIWRIDENKVLTALQPGISSWPCPFSLEPPYIDYLIVGDITVSDDFAGYANRVFVSYNDGTETPAQVVSENAAGIAAYGEYEIGYHHHLEIDEATAQALADGHVAQMSIFPQQIMFTTMRSGARAGQTITVDLTPTRPILGGYLITEVRMWDQDGKNAFFTITADYGLSALEPRWKGTYKLWAERTPIAPAAAGGGPVASLQVLLRRVTNLPSAGTNLCLDVRQTQTPGFAGFSTVVCPLDGTFLNLVTVLDVAPGGGATRSFTLHKNAVATAMVSTHGDSDLAARDIANTVSVVAGDRLLLVATITGSPAVSDLCWTLEFESVTTNESGYLTNIGTAVSGFVDLFTGRQSATSDDCRRLIPCDGTITSMIGMNTFTGVDPGEELNCFLYLNGVKQDGTGGTVDTELSVTSVAINVSVTRTFTLPVVRGDDVYLGLEEVGTYPSSWTAVSMVFEAAVDGNYILASLAGGSPSSSADSHGIVHGQGVGGAVWITALDENSQMKCGVSPISLGDLILEASDDPGAGNTRTFALMRNGSVPGATPGGVVSAGSLLIDDDEQLEFEDGDVVGPMRHTPFSSPTISGREWWSMVMGPGTP